MFYSLRIGSVLKAVFAALFGQGEEVCKILIRCLTPYGTQWALISVVDDLVYEISNLPMGGEVSDASHGEPMNACRFPLACQSPVLGNQPLLELLVLFFPVSGDSQTVGDNPSHKCAEDAGGHRIKWMYAIHGISPYPRLSLTYLLSSSDSRSS